VVGLPDQVTFPSWVLPSQSNVSLSNFGGNLAASRVDSLPAQVTLPSWVLPSQSNASFSNFGGNILADRIVGIPVLPSWVSSSQYSVLLANFGGQVSWTSQISNRPMFNWSTLKGSQSNVTLSNFDGDLPAS
jgi:hypothetical protein